MKQQPDKLFHDQLKDFRQTPPPELWSRLEEGLQRKKKSFRFGYVAASLAIVIVSAYLMLEFSGDAESAKNLLATTEELNNIPPAPSPNIPPVKEEVPAPPKETIPLEQPVRSQRHEKKELTKKRLSETPVIAERIPAFEDIAVTVPDSASNEKVFEIKTQLAFKGTPKDNNVVIVMTTEQTQAYLLNKDDSQATSEVKKSSTFKKLLKKAADLSSNQDPFGELRQKKNELLALNFKTDKQRGQKK